MAKDPDSPAGEREEPEHADHDDQERRQALDLLEGVQETLLKDLQRRIGPALPDYDPKRVGTLHGWFAGRGGEARKALQSRLDPAGVEERAAQLGMSVEVLEEREVVIRYRLGLPPANLESLLRTAAGQRSTRYTDPWWFARLEQLTRALFKARDAHFEHPHRLVRKGPTLNEIVAGTLPGVNVDARVLPDHRGRYRIIVVDETVFVFTFLLSQLFFAALVPNGPDRWSMDRDRRAEHLRANSWIGAQAVTLFRTYVRDGHLRGVPALQLDPVHEPGIAVSVTAVQLFVIGHELAHCFQPTGREWVPPIGMENALIEWQRELDADISGLQLAIQAGLDQGWGDEITVEKTLQFLLGMGMLEAAIGKDILKVMQEAQLLREARAHGEEAQPTTSHPPFMFRYQQLRQGAEYLVSPERVEQTRRLIQESHALMQDVLAPMIDAMRKDVAAGLLPHPIWRES